MDINTVYKDMAEVKDLYVLSGLEIVKQLFYRIHSANSELRGAGRCIL